MTMLVFAPLGMMIFEDLMTLELLMDFLTPRVNCTDSTGGTGAVSGVAPASASRTAMVTSALALL